MMTNTVFRVTPARRRVSDLALLAAAATMIVAGCSEGERTDDSREGSAGSTVFLSMLRSIPAEELLLTVRVSGTTIVDREPLDRLRPEGGVGDGRTVTVVPPDNFAASGEATVEIVLSYMPTGGEEVALAGTTQEVRFAGSQRSLTLDALQYEYYDNNGNGVYDFYELSSDVKRFEAVIAVRDYPDVSRSFSMPLVTSDAEVAMEMNRLSDADAFRMPGVIVGWPWSMPGQALIAENDWHVYGVSPGSVSSCASWADDGDGISSFTTSLSETALALFRRNGAGSDEPSSLFVPVGGDVAIPDLSVYLPEATPSASSGAPLDDSMLYIAVREGTWGWIRMWKSAGMDDAAGNPSCTVNLTSPPILEEGIENGRRIPDLIVRNIDMERLTIDCTVTQDNCRHRVPVTVTNRGDEDAGEFEIRVSVGPSGSSEYFRTLPGLEAGDSETFEAAPPPGASCFPDCQICAVADSGNTVLETDESNNELCLVYVPR